MNRDELRRSTKEAALACLRALGAAFAGEAEREAAVLTMINMVNDFDVKPPAPAVGFVVIGEEVGEQVVAAARQPPVTAASSDHERKRPRRQQPAENVQSRTLDDFPVGCEVLLPRTDDNGRRIGNDYCRVVSQTPDGQLRLEKKPRLVVGLLAGVDTAPSVIVRGLDGADAPADALPLVDNAAPLVSAV